MPCCCRASVVKTKHSDIKEIVFMTRLLRFPTSCESFIHMKKKLSQDFIRPPMALEQRIVSTIT